jgi:hypothetical protein
LPIIIALVGVGLVYLYWTLNKRNQELEEELFYLKAHIQRLSTTTLPTDQQEPIEIIDSVNKNHIQLNDTIQVVDYGYEQDSEEESIEEPEPVEEEMDTVREIVEEVTPAEDVVITKLSHCSHILQAGKNKGSSCGKPTVDNSGYCKHHAGPEPLD